MYLRQLLQIAIDRAGTRARFEDQLGLPVHLLEVGLFNFRHS